MSAVEAGAWPGAPVATAKALLGDSPDDLQIESRAARGAHADSAMAGLLPGPMVTRSYPPTR